MFPLAITTMGAGISSEGQPRGSNISKHSTPHQECETESAEGGGNKPTHCGTFSLLLSQYGFWLRRIYTEWQVGFPISTLPKTLTIYPVWFPSTVFCRKHPLTQHPGSSATVLGQTTWSTEGKMRLIKRKKVKPFIKFKNSVLQLSEVMSHSHLNSFLQH